MERFNELGESRVENANISRLLKAIQTQVNEQLSEKRENSEGLRGEEGGGVAKTSENRKNVKNLKNQTDQSS